MRRAPLSFFLAEQKKRKDRKILTEESLPLIPPDERRWDGVSFHFKFLAPSTDKHKYAVWRKGEAEHFNLN